MLAKICGFKRKKGEDRRREEEKKGRKGKDKALHFHTVLDQLPKAGRHKETTEEQLFEQYPCKHFAGYLGSGQETKTILNSTCHPIVFPNHS